MKGLNIVVAEDDAIIKMYMEDLLKHAGHNVVGTATSGEDAVARVGELQPDVAVMDIGLKGSLDGIGAALSIRNIKNKKIQHLKPFTIFKKNYPGLKMKKN